MLHLYNTPSKTKEPLQPIKPGKIGLYVCGLTVYNYCHVGNARVSVVFDVLTRYLRTLGYEVTYVRNITDIDDKIIHRAQVLRMSVPELTQQFILALHEDEAALGNIPPTAEPRATDNIPEMIALIDTLLREKYAYIAKNGDIYYEVSKFKAYGEFAHQNLDNLRAGTRVEVETAKRDPLDFVLWKKAKPGEPSWASPWGDGRPGWHTECVVMSALHLDERFDIHGGGADLKFPHHQNEVAQAEAIYNHPVVNIWMHVGFVEFNHEKMSKSKGNFFTLREVLKEYHPEVVRLFLLSSHYRSPLDYTVENLNMTHASLRRLYTAIKDVKEKMIIDATMIDHIRKNNLEIDAVYQQFFAGMNDDLNTPLAISYLFNLAHNINKLREQGDIVQVEQYATVLRYLGRNIFGILQKNPDTFLRGDSSGLDVNKIEQLINERQEARKNKDWKTSDQVRDELTRMGVELEDTPTGTSWKKTS
ncbi:MAG: cysteine--tRNA ligase [Gammaproteobacteria bacterium GWE2_37_16]|nr:MAG: cysteine--tRNA ligase [Gammaproteobacteria bacterium GWE2_37_16]